MTEVARKVKMPDPWRETQDVPSTAIVYGRPAALEVTGACVADNSERYANCRIAMTSGYPTLTGTGFRIFQEPCILVGTGPSAIPLLEEIRGHQRSGRQIIAIKGAHDWLVRNGIVPKAAIALDPQRSRAKCFRNPVQGVLYMCASQMHPDTWEHLRGYQVLVWHSRIDDKQHELSEWRNRLIIDSASTTGNAAILLLHALGRRHFELYGFDSSIPDASGWWPRIKNKIFGRALKLDGTRVPRDKTVVEVTADGKTFSTTAEMILQAKEIYPMLRNLQAVKITAHGDGYYQAILAAGKKNGWPI